MSGILFVDDEPLNLNLFKRRFEDSITVYTALNGAEAIAIKEQCPSITIIITDMRMPEMNGLELLRVFEKRFPDVRRFLVTGYDENDDMMRFFDKDLVEKCFYKPIDFNEIKKEIFGSNGSMFKD